MRCISAYYYVGIFIFYFIYSYSNLLTQTGTAKWNCQESCSLKNTQNSLSIIVRFADCNRCNCSSHIVGILSSSPKALVLSLTVFRKCVFCSSAIEISITPQSLIVAFHTVPDILQAIIHPDWLYGYAACCNIW